MTGSLIPRTRLFGNPARAQGQISPDGRWLSWLAPEDGVLNIWVAPTGNIGAGRVITGDYPPDHIHHHGVWFAWTKTEFEGRHPDFWNMGDGTGTVEFAARE